MILIYFRRASLIHRINYSERKSVSRKSSLLHNRIFLSQFWVSLPSLHTSCKHVSECVSGGREREEGQEGRVSKLWTTENVVHFLFFWKCMGYVQTGCEGKDFSSKDSNMWSLLGDARRSMTGRVGVTTSAPSSFSGRERVNWGSLSGSACGCTGGKEGGVGRGEWRTITNGNVTLNTSSGPTGKQYPAIIAPSQPSHCRRASPYRWLCRWYRK